MEWEGKRREGNNNSEQKQKIKQLQVHNQALAHTYL